MASASLARADRGERPLELNVDLLANRAQLAAAFGAATGLHRCWFSNLADTPVLLRARKWVEHSATNGVREFWFCPLEVMQWLVHSKRKRGRPLDADTGWALLKQHFPKVYRQQSRKRLLREENLRFALRSHAAPFAKGKDYVFQHPTR